jgi:hypothetical protein
LVNGAQTSGRFDSIDLRKDGQNPDFVRIGKDDFADLVLGSPFAYGESEKSGHEGWDPDLYARHRRVNFLILIEVNFLF